VLLGLATPKIISGRVEVTAGKLHHTELSLTRNNNLVVLVTNSDKITSPSRLPYYRNQVGLRTIIDLSAESTEKQRSEAFMINAGLLGRFGEGQGVPSMLNSE
jgi:hypothetical protein